MPIKRANQSTNLTVAVFGAFDILHPGHIFLLKQARLLGKTLVIVGRDNTILKVKGKLPFFSEQKRKKNLESTTLAYKVLLGNEGSPYEILDTVKPDIILLGPDQKAFTQNLEGELASRNLHTKIIRAKPFHIEFFKSSKIRPCLENPHAGFLPIYKPSGISSHDVVNQIRKLVQTKKVGHAGTLDPLAEGLLIIGIHEAVKLLSWWHYFLKTYEVELELGKISDTYDNEGIIKVHNPQNISLTEIKTLLPKFLGQQLQTPPQFSAKKINGHKAYELARQGIKADLKKQSIYIADITLLNYANPFLKLKVTCSSGTYIRSLVHDIGEKLQTGAIMTKLIRTEIGGFKPQTVTYKQPITLPTQIITPLELLNKINQLSITATDFFAPMSSNS